MKLKKMIRDNKPFAVAQYFVSPIFAKKETTKIYEILLCNEDTTHDGTKKVESFFFTENDKYNFKLNFDKFVLVEDNEYGKVWEYLEFKKRYNLGRYLKISIIQPDEIFNRI